MLNYFEKFVGIVDSFKTSINEIGVGETIKAKKEVAGVTGILLFVAYLQFGVIGLAIVVAAGFISYKDTKSILAGENDKVIALKFLLKDDKNSKGEEKSSKED